MDLNCDMLEEKVLKKVMGNIPIGVLVFREGKERKVYYLNSTAHEMIGYTREEYIQKVEQGFHSFFEIDFMEILDKHSESIRRGEPFEVVAPVKTKDGGEKCLLNRVVIKLEKIPVCYMVMLDVTEHALLQKKINLESERLKERAAHDSFTGLLNRGTMEELVEQAVGQLTPEVNYAYLTLDVDNFKQINDSHGHGVGDMVILQIAKLLQENFRKEDYVARMGGDEFAVFVADVPDVGFIEERLETLRCGMRRLKDDLHLVETPTVSAGIAFYPKDGKTFKMLYDNADIALYRVKNSRKGGTAVFE